LDQRLQSFGWTSELEDAFRPHAENGMVPGRISVEHRGMYGVYTAAGDMWAEVTGRMRHDATDRSELPAVGDWVALVPRPGDDWASIHEVLPRRSAFTRKVAGFQTQGQVLAANIDVVWIVGSLTRELSARRIERYLAVAWESGAATEIVLTKADLGEVDADRLAEVEAIAFGTPVRITSAVTGEGLDELRASLADNRTAAVLGVSGVGKSTLINALLGEERLATHETDAANVGRHTTVRRELVLLPGGGLVIDTPGLRELVGWDNDGGVDATFADIESLIAQCRFNDCSHRSEPGCAVRAAIADESLDPARLLSYRKMQRELALVEGRKRGKADINSKRKWKDIAKVSRQRRQQEVDR
jgi:ribosome biogenesis GTPase